jgi:uncharacterized protein (TIGR01777 family)
MAPRPRIILAGGTGFLGTGLTPVLLNAGYDVTILTRSESARQGKATPRDADSPDPIVRNVRWDARTLGPWAAELDGAAAIVNLVGRTVDCRKTDANKRVILESRVDSVRALGAACATCTNPPPVWVQTSTAHIYGDTGDELLDESSPIGEGFAPMVGTAWEQALQESAPKDCRKVILRISFVLGRNGGPLRTLARIARSFLGGRIGTGRQWISWIHEADLQAVILRANRDERMQGVYVVTSPNPVRNVEFMAALRKAVHRPWSPPVPPMMVRLGAWILRTDPELPLLGRRCVPARLLRENFIFQFPELKNALQGLLS